MVSSNSIYTLPNGQLAEKSIVSQSIAKMISVAIAMLLSTIVLFLVGFSSNSFLHGAAHDVRHVSGFPCH